MNGSLNNSETITADAGPTLGSCNVKQATVDLAVNEVLHLLAKPYLSMVSETFEKLKTDPTFYERYGYGNPDNDLPKHLSVGSISIPKDQMNSILTGTTYCALVLQNK